MNQPIVGYHLDECQDWVADLACGHGRHARFLAGLGHRVTAVDRDAQALATLAGVAGVEPEQRDLESGGAWPYAPARFDAIVVVNYLHRPLFAPLLDALRHDGVLIYATFASGNERIGRPSRPELRNASRATTSFRIASSIA